MWHRLHADSGHKPLLILSQVQDQNRPRLRDKCPGFQPAFAPRTCWLTQNACLFSIHNRDDRPFLTSILTHCRLWLFWAVHSSTGQSIWLCIYYMFYIHHLILSLDWGCTYIMFHITFMIITLMITALQSTYVVMDHIILHYYIAL